MALRVGIQGIQASFHDVAARRWFVHQDLTFAECPSFRALADRLKRRETDFAVMAIENTIAGSILPNYGLLETYGFKIVGEIYLRIEHSLMALPGQRLSDLKFVQSHPMALAQCENFLARHPHLQAIEGADTAGCAKDIQDRKLHEYAAIAHRLAAETYGLEILAEGIETDQRNYTRFLILCRGEDYRLPENSGKASLRFEAAHRPGSLAHVLGMLSAHGVNLTKIQSVPVLGRPYNYSFHVDLEWQERGEYEKALAELAPAVSNLIHFGEYPKGDLPPQPEAGNLP